MRESKVEYSDDSYDVVITVRQTSLAASFKRQALYVKQAAEILKKEKEGGTVSIYERYAALRTLPELYGATVEIVNAKDAKLKLPEEMGLDDFVQLPEALIILWERATYEVNPQWMTRQVDDESGEESEPDKNSG